MTEHSQNGWSASADLPLRPLVVNGVSFAPGIRDDGDVETVLRYVVTEFDKRVEPLRSPGCWGWSYRPNRNNPDSLSNHASGTAVDVNAPDHPNGVPTWRTFSAAQTAEVHSILTDLDHTVRWGGDYQRTADAMHFEIDCDAATLHVVAERLRGNDVTEDDMNKIADLVVAKLLAAPIDRDGDSVKKALRVASGLPKDEA